ncbi:MAG: putative ABC transporter permease [Candidatus Saccharibacteria bacterium]|nr:putative ABC transporter permease [Candidatus Saccharibacteria bacterium]
MRDLDSHQRLGVIMLLAVICGAIGWVWEFIITEFQGGFSHLYVKGGNFLPWINMYAYGAILILLVTRNFRDQPLLVFLSSAVSCGIFELLTGCLIYALNDGARYWDYTTAWWGIGNINGWVCPASVIAFGFGALALIYFLLPRCVTLAKYTPKRTFLAFVTVLFSLILIDDLTNLLWKLSGHPTAIDYYLSKGWHKL